MSDHLS